MASEIANQARELHQTIVDLTENISSLQQRLEQVNSDLYTTVSKMKLVVVGLVVGALISVGAICYIIYNNNRINRVQQRTSNEVLCPLYKLFLDSYHPEAQPPEKRQAYIDAFQVIRRSYDVLQCPRQG